MSIQQVPVALSSLMGCVAIVTGAGIVNERVDSLLTRKLDNADAWLPEPSGLPSAILKGPMYQEIRRRQQGTQSDEDL